MSLSHLELLPIELLQRICSHLESQCLSNFSCASQQCHSAACKYLFRNVQIEAVNIAGYDQTLQRVNGILERTSSHRYVHVLRLDDCQPSFNDYWSQNSNPYNSHPTTGREPNLGDLSTWSEANEEGINAYFPCGVADTDTLWKPVVQFIRNLPALQRVIWACRGHPPQPILRALRQNLPQCRIYAPILALDERPSDDSDYNYDRPASNPSDLLPWSFLSGFSVVLRRLFSETARSHRYAMLDLDEIIRNAPHLEELRIWWTIPENIPTDEIFPRRNEMPLNGTIDTTVDFYSFRKLTSVTKLQLRIDRCIEVQFVRYWNQRIDFDKLRILALEGTMTAPIMSWLSTGCSFASLQSLVLNSWWFWDSFPLRSDVDEYIARLPDFFRSLRPLTKLRILGVITDSVLSAISRNHGNSLRQLWLENQTTKNANLSDFHFGLEQIDELCRRCTKLEDLKIPIRRTNGDAREVSLYTRLGSLSALRNLLLVADVTSPYIEQPVLDNRPGQVFDDIESRDCLDETTRLRRQLREIIINFAVDSHLVEAIFHTVSSAKSSLLKPLELLCFEPTGMACIEESIYVVGLQDLLSNMARSWMVVRDQKDTHRDQMAIAEIESKRYWALHGSTSHIDQDLKDIIFRLWPRQEMKSIDAGAFWFEPWHSLPLASLDPRMLALKQTSHRETQHSPSV